MKQSNEQEARQQASRSLPPRNWSGSVRQWQDQEYRRILSTMRPKPSVAKPKADLTIRGNAQAVGPRSDGEYFEYRQSCTLRNNNGETVTKKGSPIRFTKAPLGQPYKDRKTGDSEMPTKDILTSTPLAPSLRQAQKEKPVKHKVLGNTKQKQVPVAPKEKHWGELSDEEKAAKRAALKS